MKHSLNTRNYEFIAFAFRIILQMLNIYPNYYN